MQEAAEAAARLKQEEQARLERQECPAAESSAHAGKPSTARPAKLSPASSSDESLAKAGARCPNGIAQVLHIPHPLHIHQGKERLVHDVQASFPHSLAQSRCTYASL